MPSESQEIDQLIRRDGWEPVTDAQLDARAAADDYCLSVVHDGLVSADPDEWPCPINCHDTRPWCECMCHGTDDDGDPSQEITGGSTPIPTSATGSSASSGCDE